jgi:hypothetical protein
MKRILWACVVVTASLLVMNTASSQWVQTTGIEGGQITSLLAKGDTTFAGTWGGGVYRSTNYGTTWTYAGLIGEKPRSMAIRGTTIFAGTHTGVYKSTNQGATWAASNNGTQTLDYVYNMDSSGAYLLAGGYGGISRTSDDGETWTLDTLGLTSPELPTAFIGTIYGGQGKLYCGVLGLGAFRSTDHGSHWFAAGAATLPNKYVRAFAMNDTYLFAGTDSGVYRSSDDGGTWSPFNTSLGNLSITKVVIKESNVFVGTSSGGVFRSPVASASWTAVNTGVPSVNAISLIVNYNLFVGTTAGIYTSSNDGTLWTSVNTGLTAPRVYGIAAAGDTLYAAAYGSGVFRSTNNGATWTDQLLSNRYFHPLFTKGLYVGAGSEGGYYYSTNGGATWNIATTGLGVADGRDVRAIVERNDTLWAGVAYTGVFMSTDKGANWTAVAGATGNVTSLAICGQRLFAGTMTQEGGVWMSTNNGTTWTTVNGGLTNIDVNTLAVDGTTLFAGTGGGLFKSTNYGTTWTDITGDLGANYIFSILANGPNVFVGTRNGGGLFLTKTFNTPYANVGSSAGLTTTWVSSMTTNGKYLYLGISGGGVWRRPLLEMGYQITASTKLYLQGPYTTTGDSMLATLKTNGTLAAHFVGASIPALAVDSVNIEIRDSLTAAASTVRKYAPAWLLTNGTIRSFSDTTRDYVSFDTLLAGKYYIAVWHRNHLAIISAASNSLDATVSPTVYDFSTALAQGSGSDPMVGLGTGGVAPFGMYGGNASAADQVINALDRTVTRTNTGSTTYDIGDVTLSGVVNALDRTLARTNTGKASGAQ